MNVYSYFFGLIPLVALVPMLAALWVRERYMDRAIRQRGLKHPFTRGVRRPPGYSLAVEIPELQIEAISRMFWALVIGTMIAVTAPLVLSIFGVTDWIGVSVGLVGALGWGCVEACRIIRLLALVRRKRLGWEGELATGEQLNQLYAQGYDIFHDIDGGGFNIDHVAVGPAGVFAIETKARVKRQDGQKDEYWHAGFDGRLVDFAGYRTAGPIKQAQRNAEWLSRRLTSAVGDPVAVHPVVALPGWYVNRSGKSDIRVVNPSEFGKMVRGSRTTPLDASMIQRIVHQLDALCRDVAKGKKVAR